MEYAWVTSVLKGGIMSLYTHEEICVDCNLAVFHCCCKKFCRCLEGHENEVDGIACSCAYKPSEKVKHIGAEVNSKQDQQCPICNGLGMTSGNNLASFNGRLQTCNNCNGTGKLKA
jgi:hypothetical protein